MHLFAGKSDSPERSGGASLVYARKLPIRVRMYVCTCMYVCTYVRMGLCTYVRMYAYDV